MIERVGADVANYFGSHPEVVEGMGCALDFTGAEKIGSVFLFGEHGGFLFEWTAPGTYEGHVMLTRAGRGAWGRKALAEALKMLGAERVWCRITDDRRDVVWFAIPLGFRQVERRVLFVAGEPSEYRIYEWRSECLP